MTFTRWASLKRINIILVSSISIKDTDTKEWVMKSDIMLLVIRESSTANDRTIASLRHASEKKTLFIIRTHINEIINGAQRYSQSASNEEETVKNEQEFLWSQYKEFLTCKDDIYLIGSHLNHACRNIRRMIAFLYRNRFHLFDLVIANRLVMSDQLIINQYEELRHDLSQVKYKVNFSGAKT
ncbi:unnamed protein product [Rotaria sp. Silwood2]|nr:unnamed protein product [Rotaria sp. Silwood2]CAF4668573.1 unnamed protein product [Rotaria sp. Silwood2]